MELLYEDNDISMFVFMPNPITYPGHTPISVDQLLDRISIGDAIDQALNEGNYSHAFVSLPKLTLTGEYNLKDVSVSLCAPNYCVIFKMYLFVRFWPIWALTIWSEETWAVLQTMSDWSWMVFFIKLSLTLGKMNNLLKNLDMFTQMEE